MDKEETSTATRQQRAMAELAERWPANQRENEDSDSNQWDDIAGGSDSE
jgi:hypothetical protein